MRVQHVFALAWLLLDMLETVYIIILNNNDNLFFPLQQSARQAGLRDDGMLLLLDTLIIFTHQNLLRCFGNQQY